MRHQQVLILNITRMGDLVQMVLLLGRLQEEWPGVAIDLVVDSSFAPMASLLPGLRHVLAYDFKHFIDESRVRVKDIVALYQDVAKWANPLLQAGYDRVVNLTFNRRSGYLAGYVGAPDVRGLTTAPDGSLVVKNPWMMYMTDLHCFRRINRFNIVDLFALGGSGAGASVPITLHTSSTDQEWAGHFLRSAGSPKRWIAVQVGASDPMKAWRPELFGKTMALLSQKANVGFVFIGTDKEKLAAREAAVAFRKSQRQAFLCDAVGKTTLPQLIALLSQCGLMVTNDTGPMHLAVGAGIPVVDLSVGHVDFRETGPYGPGHWVIQPDLACAPCGFQMVCSHHACKDLVIPEQVAGLCLHVLGLQAFPPFFTGVRVYESEMDEDHLVRYRLRAGQEEAVSQWYGLFWRKYLFDVFHGQASHVNGPRGISPDDTLVQENYCQLLSLAHALCVQADRIAHLSAATPLPVVQLKEAGERLNVDCRAALRLGQTSLAFRPISALFYRETHNLTSMTLEGMAAEHAQAYRTWNSRLMEVGKRMNLRHAPTRRVSYAGTT